ncbi:hypothetical protein E2C01_096700 [Portunus trituberculatus]|uniref:Uncharacterized protein n=1 Tax=Portunus trituberculatus TaxID=210409 RepID=A0A5B7JT76_PORTR|nr:hypothetical protein [Portunus trituberculatus]
MPRGNSAASAPANWIFQYEVRLLGIDGVSQQQPWNGTHRYSVGNRVWVRHPSRCCNSRSFQGTLTRIVSAQSVEVDSMPRHIRDLRLATAPLPPAPEEVPPTRRPDAEEEYPILFQVRAPEERASPERPQLRRSTQERHPTQLCQYYWSRGMWRYLASFLTRLLEP